MDRGLDTLFLCIKFRGPEIAPLDPREAGPPTGCISCPLSWGFKKVIDRCTLGPWSNRDIDSFAHLVLVRLQIGNGDGFHLDKPTTVYRLNLQNIAGGVHLAGFLVCTARQGGCCAENSLKDDHDLLPVSRLNGLLVFEGIHVRNDELSFNEKTADSHSDDFTLR